MKCGRFLVLALLVVSLGAVKVAAAQSIGGNVSIAATTSSANVQLPANTVTYPFVFLAPAVGATVELFYALGTSNAVTASNTSPALPAAGICLAVGPNSWVAGIAGSGTGTLRITQMSTCPLR